MTSPREVVEEFFARMEDDRRYSVGELFADDAIITVPGARFEGSDAATEMLTFFDGRYKWAAKKFDYWVETGDVAMSQGTLYGVDGDGKEFDDIRYVDVYRITDGVIVRLDVYNDLLAEGIV